MAVNVSIAPFINVEFYLTGAFREEREGGRLHKGVDLSTGTDGSVYTIDSGEVIAKGYGLGYYGYLITWNRETNKGTLYGDLRQEPALTVGMPVAVGQYIGVEGPVDSRHVHIERKTLTNADKIRFIHLFSNSWLEEVRNKTNPMINPRRKTKTAEIVVI